MYANIWYHARIIKRNLCAQTYQLVIALTIHFKEVAIPAIQHDTLMAGPWETQLKKQ